MGRIKKQGQISHGQCTISKFFGGKESKSTNLKREISVEQGQSTDVPVKLMKLESLGLSLLNKEKTVVLSTTTDKINKFSYQEGSSEISHVETSVCSTNKRSSNIINQPIKKLPLPSKENASDEDNDEEMDVDIENEKHLKSNVNKSGKTKYTPLEQQYLDFKKEYPDAILFIECGYKYRLFGEDAQVASKLLQIGCFVSHNFHSSSIPVHRLSVHVRRLVASGHKVGVIKQTETAALKAVGDNKNTLFSRKLHALYTASTLIGEDFNKADDNFDEPDKVDDISSSLAGYLVCIHDIPSSNEKITTVGVMAVNPTAGDIIYSSFDDTVSRSELESCLTQLNPIEIIIPESSLTERTHNLIKNFCDIGILSKKNIRIEKLSDTFFNYSNALSNTSDFFSNDEMSDNKNDNSTDLSGVLSLPPVIICCISALISYLAEFRLEILLKNWKQWQPMSNTSTNMALNAQAIRNLEIMKNSTDGSIYGSLLWTVNFTQTKFGGKLLKIWLMKPLKNQSLIEERLDTVTEIIQSDSGIWKTLEKVLSKLPDVEKLLCAAFYHRCTCSEFITLVKALTDVKKDLRDILERINIEVQGAKIKHIVSESIILLDNVESFVNNIDENAARKEDKAQLFIDTSKYPKVSKCQTNIKDVEDKLNNLKKEISHTLHLPAFNYSTVMGQKYLIEVKNNQLSLIPANWMKISSTKQVSRFRSPEVEDLFNNLRQLLEELQQHCTDAWISLLGEFGNYFYKYKRVVTHLAHLDCFLSFSKVARQESFCRPTFTNENTRELNILQGRNPIISKLIGDNNQYVANDTTFDQEKRCLIITGPNMGGKSSYVKQVALIAILAQIGSYVPAVSAQLPLFDGIYVRMGADDDVVRERRSTFFTEMLETSGIFAKATNSSLVILDELGRGTSTHDGSAIAHASLDHLINKVKCTTLFVTHYPDIARQLQEIYPDNVYSCHMSFFADMEVEDDIDIPDVTFLYALTPGIAPKSYGINVARLAGIESEILIKAKEKSAEFKNREKNKRFIYSIVKSIMKNDISELKNLQITH